MESSAQTNGLSEQPGGCHPNKAGVNLVGAGEG